MSRRVLRLIAPAALLLLAACMPQSRGQARYGPWEEGLTLAYEDPSVAQPQRSQQRLQVRVARSGFQADGSGRVVLDYTSLQGFVTLVLHHQAGGIEMVGDDGRVLARLLPEGFPRTTAWEDRGVAYQVVGRGTWDGASLLPATAPAVGIWVEARPAQGPLRRTLYLPDLGEVETREFRGGAWVTTNRLVARGFTDLPPTTSRS